jgi:hypothetical protein
MAIKWFNSINGFSVGNELTEVIDTTGNVFTSKITSYIDVDIASDNGNKIWIFNSSGNISFPDTTIQTTAYPGSSTALTLTGNVAAGAIKTDSILHANGAPYNFSTSAAGTNTQIQFNNANSFGASANLTFNNVTNTFTTYNVSATTGYFSSNVDILGTANANSGIFYGNSTNGKNALQVGVTGFTAIPNTVAQYTGNLNNATQINFQNINTGAAASTDLVLTADNGNSTTNYINMGITGSSWDGSQLNSLGNALVPDDGYVYNRGGNLVLGTSKNNTTVKFVVGGPSSANLVATISKTNVNITGNVIVSGYANFTGDIYGNTITANANLVSNSGVLTLNTGSIAVIGSDAGIFTTGIGNVNIGLAANVTLGSVTGNVTARGNLIVESTAIITNLKVSDVYSNRTPVSVTTNTVIDSFPVIKYRSAKYTMRVNSDDGYQAVEVLLIHDSANSYVTIYGSLSTIGYDIIALSTNIVAGNVRLLATTVSTNTTVNLLGVYVAD